MKEAVFIENDEVFLDELTFEKKPNLETYPKSEESKEE